jgi:FAD/FMN-containing dehydrogenase
MCFGRGDGRISRMTHNTARTAPVIVNDIHSRLNRTAVHELVEPRSVDAVVAAVSRAADQRLAVAVCGGRHAMGGQQFAEGGLQLDMSGMDRVLDFDPGQSLVTVQSGIQWPGLLTALQRIQGGRDGALTFRQKQTGANRLSVGGALAANVHGRGLGFKPFVADVESFTLVDATGHVRRCSRAENSDLFALAIGGYGLLGVVCEVTMRLVPRRKVQRIVEVTTLDAAVASYDRLVADGFTYGDFQFAIDPASPDFLRKGVLSVYRPVAGDTPITAQPVELGPAQWERLITLAHTDRSRAFAVYADHYLRTHGQVYWSDLHQFAVYVDDYHDRIGPPGSEMITEVFVPRDQLIDFMAVCRDDFSRHAVDLIYGTVRAIRRDDETFLPWARDNYGCIVFNLHVNHDPAGIAKATRDFRRLIDRAVARGGSFYLTYHRWATREQLLAAYPRFPEFLAAKLAADPDERFQSQCYRHWRDLMSRPPVDIDAVVAAKTGRP